MRTNKAPLGIAIVLVGGIAACGGSPHDGSPGDGGENHGDGATSSGPSYATPYFPLQAGLTWSYKQTASDGSVGTDCYDDGSTLTITGGAETNGTYPMVYSPACFYDEIDYTIVPDSGDSGVTVTETALGGTYNSFEFPPLLNEMYGAGGASGETLEWDMHVDTFTVAAGTFDDCWRLSINGGGIYEYLCKDVGLVLATATQFQDYRWELTSKSF